MQHWRDISKSKDMPGSFQFPTTYLIGALITTPIIATIALGLQWYFYPLVALVLALPTFALVMKYHSNQCFSSTKVPDWDSVVKFRDEELRAVAMSGRLPMETFYEAYFSGKLDITCDVLTFLEQRHEFVHFGFTWNHVKFFVTQWIPETIWHSRAQDREQVCDHYNRGNDFYEAFLGSVMIYTSGIVKDAGDSLEDMQKNKMALVCEKLHLEESDKMLDIGCGWGTLTCFAAHRSAHVTGVTLAKEQAQFAEKRALQQGVSNNVEFLCKDYRDITNRTFNKIACLEMAEHVGVLQFQKFLGHVTGMLENDGTFFLQIAGLRRRWQYEDLNWGLFMAKYVFPGADASMPLAWVIGQLETAGLEVHSVETIGIHYSATIEKWYTNWISNKKVIESKYGVTWFRKWSWFLGWSVIAARQGSATCYQIVSRKNLCSVNRAEYIEE